MMSSSSSSSCEGFVQVVPQKKARVEGITLSAAQKAALPVSKVQTITLSAAQIAALPVSARSRELTETTIEIL